MGGAVEDVYEAGLAAGVIVRPLAGCFVMAPPLILTEAEIAELGRRVKASLDRILANHSAR